MSSQVLTIVIASTDKSVFTCLAKTLSVDKKTTIHHVEEILSLHSIISRNDADLVILDMAEKDISDDTTFIETLNITFPDLIILPIIPPEQRKLIQDLISQDIFYYLHTPIEPAEVTLTVKRAIDQLSTEQNDMHAAPSTQSINFHGMIAASSTMHKLFDLITKVADDDESTVLIRGESGTGKEMVAKAIHNQSPRQGKNFVPVNCAAIPDDLLESELFGYAKGAFTGATNNKIGRIQYADGGTLFLDEIGDMKPQLQAKLLRVLQEKEFEPVGALKPQPVDTRILAATHCDLEQLVKQGKFREDLYYRLSVIPLNIPPLKERREDVPLLIEAFIEAFTVNRNRPPFTFSSRAHTALSHFEWRGNVRELENLIQHMSILYGGKEVDFEDLPEKFLEMKEVVANPPEPLPMEEPITVPLQTAPETNVDVTSDTPQSITNTIPWHEGQVDFRELINSFETELIVQAMKMTGGNKKEAARLLNLKRTTLLEKIKKKELQNLWQE